MLTVETASRLRAAGMDWSPRSGDRFVVADRGMDDQVFVVSEMVIEHFRAPHGPSLLRFNGTTEWALDQLAVTDAIWLPREDQLREAIGTSFVALAHTPSGWTVTVADGSGYESGDPEEAYAAALLAVLQPARR